MNDQEPLLVFRQRSDKKSPTGSRHLVAGLGMVERFEAAAQVFRIRGLHAEEVSQYISGTERLADDLLETALRLESLEDWTATRSGGPSNLSSKPAETGSGLSGYRAIKLRFHLRGDWPTFSAWKDD